MTSAHYPNDPASIGDARAFVANVFGDLPGDLRERAVLITSELATNAVTHANSDFTVTASLTSDELQISVRNNGGAVPLLRHPSRTETHGRGLLIASTLSDNWGIDTRPDSTTVWFSLTLEPSVAAQLTGSSARRPGRPVPDGSSA